MQIEKKYKKKKKLGSYPYASVVFSISLALFVIGLFGLLLLHANKLKELIRQNIEIQVYLNKYITENERIRINKALASKDYVLVEDDVPQITYISKEEAAEQFIEETGEDFTTFLGENPLRDAYTIKIKEEYHERDKLTGIKDEVEGMSGVFEVTYIESLIDSINDNVAKISIVLGAFALILLLTVVMLINNTIKLALFSQRFLIRSMQLVGATAGFIQKPFLYRATFHGILAGLVAALMLMGLMYYANNQIEDLSSLQDPEKIMYLFLSLLLIGGFIGLLSTFRAIRKYLKMSLDELY